MLRITIQGSQTLELEHVVCDLNGTLAKDGELLDGVVGRLVQLSQSMDVHVLTADTHGTLSRIIKQLITACVSADVPPPRWQQVGNGAEKERYVRELGAEHVVALGNGTNDAQMFRVAALAIGILGPEGMSGRALLSAHVVTGSALEGLDLLVYPDRLVATLRP